MTDRPHLRQVVSWLADLANLTAGNAPLADSKTKIAALASMLAEDYPPGAFCRASLAAVAGNCRFFPCYSEICEHLGGWWLDHRPTAPAIAPPSRDAWEKRVQDEHAQAVEDWASPFHVRSAVNSLNGHPMRGVLGPLLASLVSRHAPDNVQFLPPEWQPKLPGVVVPLVAPA